MYLLILGKWERDGLRGFSSVSKGGEVSRSIKDVTDRRCESFMMMSFIQCVFILNLK